MKLKSFILAPAVAIALLASCEKADCVFDQDEVIAVENNEVTVAEAVEALTRSVSKEDLKDLSLFLKQGSSEGSIYLAIAKDSTEIVSGEVSLIAGESYKLISLNLTLYGALPVVGTIDAVQLAVGLAKAKLFLWNEEKLNKYLAVANNAVDVKVLFTYHVELRPIVDEESGKVSIEPFLVSDEDADTVIRISDLVAMFV